MIVGRGITMKKLLVPALAAALLLAACNSTEEGSDEKTPETQATPQTEEVAETPETTEDVTDNTEEVTEEPATTPQDEEDTVTEVNIYGSDDNAEKVELKETITHSLKENGPLTPFILEKLGLLDYYNTHAVSADEKTITIDFKELITSSQFVQGSAGGSMFLGEIYASFFESIDTLETIKLRVEGQELELDHVTFSGEVKREDFLSAYPEVQ